MNDLNRLLAEALEAPDMKKALEDLREMVFLGALVVDAGEVECLVKVALGLYQAFAKVMPHEQAAQRTVEWLDKYIAEAIRAG